jgi:hypothetical protein
MTTMNLLLRRQLPAGPPLSKRRKLKFRRRFFAPMLLLNASITGFGKTTSDNQVQNLVAKRDSAILWSSNL